MKKIFTLLLITLLTISCKKNQNTTSEIVIDKDKNINEIFTLMQGSFSSQVQSEVDTTYFNISLHMYPIWKDKGRFLYVEQAMNAMQDKPYRQRIYELTQIDSVTFKSAVYTLAVDSLWINKWKTPEVFDNISISDITLKEGCEVILKRIEPNYYKGKTGDNSCESTLRGASYARSEVEIFEDKIISWDRGFDSQSNYVWGAEKGGYVFNKLD